MTEQQIRRVAAEANLDPRTVKRIVDGGRPRSDATRAALISALLELGHSAVARRVKGTKS